MNLLKIFFKAAAEETRRKCKERLQKAAAAREENVRQKAMLPTQAKKEREEKQLTLAAEKENENRNK